MRMTVRSRTQQHGRKGSGGLAWLGIGLMFVFSCAPAATDRVFGSELYQLRVKTVAAGLEHPWSLAFLPQGRMLVTERPGRMRIVNADGTVSPPLKGVPKVAARGQGGLFDV